MIVEGLMILASMICMVGLVITNIHMTNEALKKEQERRTLPWTWD